MKRLTTLFTMRRLLTAAVVLAVLTGAAVVAWRFMPEKAPTPEPAVPAGQLEREMAAADATQKTSAITIDAATAEALGLQTAPVEPRIPDAEIRTTGRVVPDERRMSEVHTKIDGWIEKTFVDFEGQQVRAGEPMFTVYSPDLVATQQELLLALEAKSGFEQSDFEVVRESGDSLVESARRRLRLWDMTPRQIAEIERTREVQRAVTVYAPASGVVTERKAYPGTRVMPDTMLYRLADLSHIWVDADVFEVDLPAVRVGATATVTLAGGETRAGKVTYVNPMVDPQSRTAQVRVELANPRLTLKPGMYVDVVLSGTRAPELVVPRDAVLDTGTRQLALVAQGDGRYELREIRTGLVTGDSVVVLSGLGVGERVARNVQFLVDSETSLREAVK